MSWQDDPVIEQSSSWMDDPIVDDATAPQSARPDVPVDRVDQLKNAALKYGREGARQVGRLGLNITEGVLGLPLAAADAGAGLVDKGLAAVGSDYRVGPISATQALDPQGYLAPQNATERFQDSITRALSGAATGIGAGSSLATAVSPVVAGIGNTLQLAPGFQALSAGTGAASAQGAKEAGGGPLLQGAAGLVGALTPYGAVEGTKALARGGRALVEPFTEAGRKQVVGRTLNQAATDPKLAQENLANAKEIVPGSKPTVAEVSQDYGLISAQRAARTQRPEEFALRSSQQNTARQQYLDRASKDQQALDAAIKRREDVTGKLRDAAFERGRANMAKRAEAAKELKFRDSRMVQEAPEPLSKPVIDAIEGVRKSPSGQRDAVESSMKWLRDKLKGIDDPADLYAIRQDIGDAMEGRLGGDQSKYRLARSELIDIRKVLDKAIEEVAPGFKEYLVKYRQLSRPIERIEALQGAQSKASLAPSDAMTGREVLSQAKFKQQAKALSEAGVLTKGQRKRVDQIAQDLDRGMAINDPNIRAVGSNTTQDMTAANVVGQALGNAKLTPFVKTITRPLQWLYKLPEQELQDLLTEAMLDPATASALMRNATGSNLAQVSKLLRQRFLASVVGTEQGLATPRSAPAESTQE